MIKMTTLCLHLLAEVLIINAMNVSVASLEESSVNSSSYYSIIIPLK